MYLISPRVALGTAVIAGIALVLAVVVRRSDAPEEVAAEAETTLDAGVSVDAPEVLVTSTPPTIAGVKAQASLAAQGIDLNVDAAVTLAGPMQQREHVFAKARCKIEGEWFSGGGYVSLSRAPAGTNVIATKVRIGSQHTFTALPAECQLGFEYSSYAQKPSKRAWLARMCWNGREVLDKPCAMTPTTELVVSTIRVSPQDGFEVSFDAELERPLDDKHIELAAECTLPDGSTQQATTRVSTYGVHAGRPFTSRARLFGRGQQAIPASCTVTVEVADLQQLVREPAAAFCWKADGVTSGACRA